MKIDRSLADQLHVRDGRLYRLSVIGGGGAAIESLTSFMTRLAAAHLLPSGLFLMQELAPFFRRRTILDGRGQCDFFGKMGASLNGLGGIAGETVRILALLTGRDNLDRLTMLPFRDCIAPRSSIRLFKNWCPQCFKIARRTGVALCELLIWQMHPLRVCALHPDQQLQSKCAACGKSQFLLARHSFPGFCSRCGHWLGTKLGNMKR